MTKYIQTLKILLVTSMLIFPGYLMAQDENKNDDPETNAPGFDPNVDDTAVPFDGGVSLLVAAGVGYGLKKARDSRKKALQEDKEVTEKQ